MNADAVKTLLARLGVDVSAERAAAIAAEIAAIGARLANAPRPTFEDEPGTFQALTQSGERP